MNEFFDPRRNKKIHLTPEERVRCIILQKLEDELHFPKHLIAVEKGVKEMANHPEAPNRRIDILGFEEGTMLPLLLIECKAVPLTDSMLDQVLGYNHFIGARSICLVNKTQCIVGINKGGVYSFRREIPSYEELTTGALGSHKSQISN